MSRYRSQAHKFSAALEEQDSKLSSLQRNYNRAVRDLEQKEALFSERIRTLEGERDGLRKWEQRSQHLAIEVEELRRKAEARHERSSPDGKGDDKMRNEIHRESIQCT